MKTIILAMSMFSLATCQPHSAALNGEKKTAEKSSNMKVEPDYAVATSSAKKTPDPVPLAETAMNKQNYIYLKEGENKFLKEYEMNVTFKSVVEDSRCPKGTECVWQGTAVAEVEFMGLYTRPMTLRLSTVNDQKKQLTRTQVFNGYDITLAEVTPEPAADKGGKSLRGNYRIAIVIQPQNPDSPTQSDGTTKR